MIKVKTNQKQCKKKYTIIDFFKNEASEYGNINFEKNKLIEDIYFWFDKNISTYNIRKEIKKLSKCGFLLIWIPIRNNKNQKKYITIKNKKIIAIAKSIIINTELKEYNEYLNNEINIAKINNKRHFFIKPFITKKDKKTNTLIQINDSLGINNEIIKILNKNNYTASKFLNKIKIKL